MVQRGKGDFFVRKILRNLGQGNRNSKTGGDDHHLRLNHVQGYGNRRVKALCTKGVPPADRD